MEQLIRERFPDTDFTFNSGPGNTGPDVVWTGGAEPGFDLADFKPDTEYGRSSIGHQAQRWAADGWRGASPPGHMLRVMPVHYTRGRYEVFMGDLTRVGENIEILPIVDILELR